MGGNVSTLVYVRNDYMHKKIHEKLINMKYYIQKKIRKKNKK